MKGLAIYTIVIYGLGTIGLFADFDSTSFLGWIGLTPIFIFAILYLVKISKEAKIAHNQGTSKESWQQTQS